MCNLGCKKILEWKKSPWSYHSETLFGYNNNNDNSVYDILQRQRERGSEKERERDMNLRVSSKPIISSFKMQAFCKEIYKWLQCIHWNKHSAQTGYRLNQVIL